ncbi:substrate-binding domain-containing protein [Cryptosporangium minutisporangium]|uniref:substrate-binding domain-containing protein n=1 Tax=Cryptosporangium minutisporangium TaxID=113569 RepID=UPI0031E5B623
MPTTTPVRHSRRTMLFATSAVAALLAVASCSQGDSTESDASSSPSNGPTASAPLPSPFNGDPVTVALVRQSGAGDYFEAWGQGAQKQAAAANIKLTVTDARNDNAKQASDLQQAIDSKPAAIIVDHGQTDTIAPLVKKAVAAGIPTIVYDVALPADVTGYINTSQSDESLAQAVLDQMIKDIGQGQKVGLVSATGFAPLDRRGAVWKKIVADNKLQQAFFTGKVTESTATDNIPLVDAALKQHPDVKAIFAPYDEITKGVVQAVRQNNLQDKVKVYGIDISNADLEVMTASGSPWVATAATDPGQIGAAVVRTIALKLAGQFNESAVQFPGVLITQELLTEKKITTVGDVVKAQPELKLDKISVADWLPNAA